jgi:hypothetical protein
MPASSDQEHAKYKLKNAVQPGSHGFRDRLTVPIFVVGLHPVVEPMKLLERQVRRCRRDNLGILRFQQAQ